MRRLATIRTSFWDGGALWLIDASSREADQPRSTDFHAHHAIQVVFNLEGAFEISGRDGVVFGDVVAVAPDVDHLFASESLSAILFVEPESRRGRAISKLLFEHGPIVAAPSAAFRPFIETMRACWRAGDTGSEDLAMVGRSVIDGMAAQTPARAVDHRIHQVMTWAREQIERPLSLAEFAPELELSPGRLRHLFVEQTGLPFKTYLLWLRLNLAVECIVDGASLTQAAYDAGFADSAHFSRTFRRMFGVPPAALRMS